MRVKGEGPSAWARPQLCRSRESSVSCTARNPSPGAQRGCPHDSRLSHTPARLLCCSSSLSAAEQGWFLTQPQRAGFCAKQVTFSPAVKPTMQVGGNHRAARLVGSCHFTICMQFRKGPVKLFPDTENSRSSWCRWEGRALTQTRTHVNVIPARPVPEFWMCSFSGGEPVLEERARVCPCCQCLKSLPFLNVWCWNFTFLFSVSASSVCLCW